jgi:hypothetical protein
VDRISGLLTPMAGIWKRIHGAFGETRIGPLPVWSFRCERKEWGVALIYHRPFSGLVDELRPEPDGTGARNVPDGPYGASQEKRGGRENGSAR